MMAKDNIIPLPQDAVEAKLRRALALLDNPSEKDLYGARTAISSAITQLQSKKPTKDPHP